MSSRTTTPTLTRASRLVVSSWHAWISNTDRPAGGRAGGWADGRAGGRMDTRSRAHACARAHTQTQGRTDAWAAQRPRARAPGRTDARTHARTHAHTHAWTDGRTDACTHARTDGRQEDFYALFGCSDSAGGGSKYDLQRLLTVDRADESRQANEPVLDWCGPCVGHV